MRCGFTRVNKVVLVVEPVVCLQVPGREEPDAADYVSLQVQLAGKVFHDPRYLRAFGHDGLSTVIRSVH